MSAWPSLRARVHNTCKKSVGSLLEGLTPRERQDIYLIVLIAHSNPLKHPAYREDMLFGLAYHVLTYDFGGDGMQQVRNIEAEGGMFTEKGLSRICNEGLL